MLRAMTKRLRHARGELSLDHCLVMGIVNRTPDSFYDGGRMDLETAVEHSRQGRGTLFKRTKSFAG